MLEHWVWLASLRNVGNRTKYRLLRHFHDPEAVYNARREIPGLIPKEREALAAGDLTEAKRILDSCKDITVITMADERYPGLLKQIPDLPLLLYCRGNLISLEEEPTVAIVGTRRCSGYGSAMARSMAGEIARDGGIVVSGLAAGIDTAAMTGALEAGGYVIGVVGGGPDVVYPVSNRELYRQCSGQGCILSEYPPGAAPTKWTFPRRNRIVSGLSKGVLVVEAPEKSGALITAHFAAEQGRDVFVVPGKVDNPACAGSNRLLREGATAVTGGWDVLMEYRSLYPDKIRQRRNAPPVPRRETAVHRQPAAPASPPEAKQDFSGLTPEEGQIVRVLLQGERTVDDVIAETGMGAGKVMSLLTMLEIKGKLRRLPGKRMILK